MCCIGGLANIQTVTGRPVIIGEMVRVGCLGGPVVILGSRVATTFLQPIYCDTTTRVTVVIAALPELQELMPGSSRYSIL